MSCLPGGEERIPAATHATETAASAALRHRGAVHDVNQMLGVIMGRAELLLQRGLIDGSREDLAAIVLAAGDAAAMLERLRGDLPPRSMAPVAVNLGETVREVALLIRPGGTGRWASPTGNPPAGSWLLDQVVPDDLFTSVPGQVVRQVLSNLLVNALEALPDGGRIKVDAAADPARVVLRVADDGPGLDKAAAGYIFEPGTTTSGSALRGIGLAGSRQLLESWGGRLDLGPDQKPGAMFVMDLPRALPARAEPPAEAPSGVQAGLRRAGFPVLVVDDEPAMRDMLHDVLTEMGCRVVAVRDAGSALDGFVPGAFGLALLDQSLPGRSGLELAALLRERDPHLTVALITGWGRHEILAGVDPAIVDLTATKPVAWARIIELLEQGESLNRRRRDQAAGGSAKG